MRRLAMLVPLLLFGFLPATAPPVAPISTFSIVAYEPETGSWGVGVASRVLAVGSVVPYGKAGVGAIATQSYANTTFGPKGLELLAAGKSADDVVKELIAADPQRERRQLGIVDAKGNAAHFTGKECIAWCGAKAGKHFTCQGNMLAGDAVIADMARAYENGKGPLAWRIMAALEAAEKAGGDKRGKQSAAILIVKDKAGYAGFNDKAIDLRVDDHADPIPELARILAKRVKKPQ